MNNALWLDPSISSRICLTLLHSLWQVGLLALVAWTVDRLWRRSVDASDAVHVAAIVIALVALPITFTRLSVATPSISERDDSSETMAGAPAALVSDSASVLRPVTRGNENQAEATLSSVSLSPAIGALSDTPDRSSLTWTTVTT